ncbi:hypothetical protein BURMUCGD2M_4929 [Burkholderia multivorans CGD2M]|uniref:Uncharacterized protein n=1 Tax=Burkholderia multivorans CGD2 TaxID=513052 RepID=B9BIN0_9BURK|nr:hypothetical protein BURMUCGD2_4936 [Burkholderia multivorans CGD2]EEE15486.1 hypothetical protein BURMUCGD2M_4929 [Burkholderia multivorans CGD2M]
MVTSIWSFCDRSAYREYASDRTPIATVAARGTEAKMKPCGRQGRTAVY